MKKIKKYTDVLRYGKEETFLVFTEGDYITITEKIDCANASFVYDGENEVGVSCYSRNQELTKDNNLQGFYGWVKDNIAPIKDKLNHKYRYFGEWGSKHKVHYKKEVYGDFHMFSIWDEEKEEYLSDEIVKAEAKKLGLRTVPYFYEGEFISIDHLMSFVGKSELSVEQNDGEGIVVKNAGYKNKFGQQIFVKIVTEKFKEVKNMKNPEMASRKERLKVSANSVVTEARVEKILYKLEDEGLLEKGYGVKDMGSILKTMGNRVFDDIMKEEAEMFEEHDPKSVKKIVAAITVKIIKEILVNKEK